MLSHEDNETLIRVGPGTPMGEFHRLYWIPFLLSKDLVPDGPPKRVKLLGEDLVAFRASDNAVGLVDNACAHRGAPLIYARNEECGLRCVYHGWKFDVNGQVIDMPAEPAHSRFKDKVRIKAYPCRERNGVVWTYMGRDGASPPPLPNIEWNLVPEERSHVSMRVEECNWLQALEGEIDSAHAPILHSRIDGQGRLGNLIAGKDLRPVFECVRQEFGVSIAARRNLPDGRLYWRVNQFVLPFYTMVPPQSKYPELSGHAWIPMDDEHTLCLMFTYHPSDPLPAKMRDLFDEGYNNRETGHASRHAKRQDDASRPYAGYWTKFNRENDFHFNYELSARRGSPDCRACGFKTRLARVGSRQFMIVPRRGSGSVTAESSLHVALCSKPCAPIETRALSPPGSAIQISSWCARSRCNSRRTRPGRTPGGST